MTESDPRAMKHAVDPDFQPHVILRRVQERAKALRDLPEPPPGLVYDGSTSNPAAARQKAYLDLAAREIIGDKYEWSTIVDFAGKVHLRLSGKKPLSAHNSPHYLRDEFG